MREIKFFALIAIMMTAMCVSCSNNSNNDKNEVGEPQTETYDVKRIERISICDRDKKGNIPVILSFTDGTYLELEKGNEFVLSAPGDVVFIGKKSGEVVPYWESDKAGVDVEGGVVIERCWNGPSWKLVMSKSNYKYEIYRFEKGRNEQLRLNTMLAQPGDMLYFDSPYDNNGLKSGVITKVGFAK